MRVIFVLCLSVHLFSSCAAKGLKVYNNVTDAEYYTMPPLFHLDDYDSCLSNSESLYCYATVQLSPVDPLHPSKLWNIIEEVISTPRMYRHDRIRHGLCIPVACPQLSQGFYAVGNGSEEVWTALSAYYTDKYSENGLKGNVVKLHCENGSRLYQVDGVDVLYILGIGLILALTCAGSIYEGSARNSPNEYVRMITTLIFGKVMTAFSIGNNWERLRAATRTEIGIAMQPVQGIRVYNMLLVIFSHTLMILMSGPVFNPKYVEDSTLLTENMIFCNGAVTIQTFFLISGWLLSHTFLGLFENKKVRFRHVALAFLNRYLRLAPIMLVTIGFSATWLRHMGDGPVYHKQVADEFRNCRKNWWVNMLFLNNYYKQNEMCLQQTWYLASEMQCFVLGLLIMMAVINKPKCAKALFTFFIIGGIVVSIGHNYYMDYDIIFRSYPETLYTMYLEYKQWLDTYIAGHMAIPCYVQGMVFGYYYYYLKKGNKDFLTNRFTWFACFITLWILPLGVILIGGKFYEHNFEYSRWQAALYQGVYRYAFGTPIGFGIMAFLHKKGGRMLSVLTWSPLQVIARTSFTVFLVHTAILRIRYGVQRTPHYITDFSMIGNTLGDYCLSIIMGTAACVIVEMPFSVLTKLMSTPIEHNDKENTLSDGESKKNE